MRCNLSGLDGNNCSEKGFFSYTPYSIFQPDGLCQYRFAIELAPSAPASCINVGNASMSRNLIDEAVQQYLIAVRLDLQSTSAHQNLGELPMRPRACRVRQRSSMKQYHVYSKSKGHVPTQKAY